ncbi:MULTISPECIES: type IV toxin-antitoxin system AbiEi family antitoxin domain-containing protein [unclassified Nocardioides]|uniref:type IV toxin-antitoxin system AbiEi family antitoxin domain-containing protein n=1 Tax=unclassified Nocardioides TaxID=2615069 RepID=UPI0006FCD0C7|nr:MULTISPECIES: type IV toxin-antitoxin system AbiEi family antitoxin domain-containing protein [unclassified Nocardioides]KRA28206.1 hypothetical protein ASD81_23975 [Nocardioides sp. Root614]KRA86180.1 hypothetical protein ASD84_24215 [Nocardioides sp. Root682]
MTTTSHYPEHPFTSAEAAALGVSHRRLELDARDGVLTRWARGVYARAEVPDSVELRAAVVALAASNHHVIRDRTAAWLLGVDMHVMSEHDLLPPIETCALRGRNPTRRPEADGRTRDLAPHDIIEAHGLRVTSPLRTAMDLGCNLRRREAFAAMTTLARLHGFTALDLAREVPRFRGRRGVIQCRGLVPLVDQRIESPREAWVLIAIHDAGLPLPEPQHWIEIDEVPTYRLDFAYVNARVYVEYQGADYHDRTQQKRDADQIRRTWLRENGWTLIEVRRGDFTGAALDRWIRELRAALAPSYTNRRW